MTAARLLVCLRRRGAILQAAGDRLRVDAPIGVVTDADRAALAEHKAELLAMLRSSTARVERVESGLQGTLPSGFLRILRHTHVCPICSREFRCTAPECAGKPTECTCCKLDRIERRDRR
jgi:hypothetical protein